MERSSIADKRHPDEVIQEIAMSSARFPLRFSVVEGPDDHKIYGRISDQYSFSYPVYYVESKRRVCQVFTESDPAKRRNIAFFADRDVWVFTGVPERYEGVFLTKGYSIENDLFEDGWAELMGNKTEAEQREFINYIRHLAGWFAFEAERLVQLREATGDEWRNSNFDSIRFGNHTDDSTLRLTPTFLENRGYVPAAQAWHEYSQHQPFMALRGKFLTKAFNLSFAAPEGIKNIGLRCGLASETSNCARIARQMTETYTLNLTP